MADVENDLSRELTRVISCPYPASLAKLGDIAVRTSDRMVVEAILDRPPCAIHKLASLVSAALPLWAYTLPLLQSLCRSPDFIDQLLLHSPELLHALLAKANASRCEFDEYAELCVLLLSRPLPEHIVLPVSAQTFFLRMFEEATGVPDVVSLKPIYYMLNGACRDLLGLLSPDARQDFDKRLCRILSSNSTGQNSMLLLWCFGIVLLAEHPREVGRTQAHGAKSVLDREWKTASGRKLFGSVSGIYKTINLTYLSVIWATKGDVGVSDMEAAEGIRIAMRAMQFVKRDIRKAWPTSSPLAASIYPKLQTKILRKEIDTGVQFEAISFYAMIADETNISRDIITQLEAVLLDIGSMRIDKGALHETLAVALPLFAEHLHETVIRKLLSRLLHTSASSRSPFEISSLIILTEQLMAIATDSVAMRSQILLALSHAELQPSLSSFLGPENRLAQSEAGEPPCETTTALLRRKLLTATVSMVLTSALTARTVEPALSHQLALDLVRKQQELTQSKTECSHAASTLHAPVSIFEQQCTPNATVHRDWRERLASEIEMQSYFQRDSVIRFVAQICEDLESRCNNVEEPLRTEQTKVNELTQVVQQLRVQVRSLETESMDRRLYIDGLEAEIDHLCNEKEETSSHLELLKTELADANKRADMIIHAAQEDFDAKELQFRSTISDHEDELHARSREMEEQVVTVVHLEEELRKVTKAKDTLERTEETLRAKLSDTEHSLETKTADYSAQSDQIRCLTDNRTNLEQRLTSGKEELRAMEDQLERLEARHTEYIRSSEEVLQNLVNEHDHKTRIATTKSNDEYAKLNGELQDALHNELQAKDLYEDARRDLHLTQTAVAKLESKVQQLTSLCSEKDEELHELRTLRSRVLASMGLAVECSLPIRSSNQTSDARPPPGHRRRKSSAPHIDNAPKGALGSQGATNTAMEDVANASFTSSESSSRSGSTPKRAKPRSSFKIPMATRTPHSQKLPHLPKSISNHLSPSKRPALKAMSPNRRHTTVGFAFAGKDNQEKDSGSRNRRGSLYSVEQASFDMDELVGGTPFTPDNFVSGTGREPDEEGTAEL